MMSPHPKKRKKKVRKTWCNKLEAKDNHNMSTVFQTWIVWFRWFKPTFQIFSLWYPSSKNLTYKLLRGMKLTREKTMLLVYSWRIKSWLVSILLLCSWAFLKKESLNTAIWVSFYRRLGKRKSQVFETLKISLYKVLYKKKTIIKICTTPQFHGLKWEYEKHTSKKEGLTFKM